MATVAPDQNPVISDTILFNLPTPDISGCPADPYKVDSVVIYFVERDFANPNEKTYNAVTYQADKLAAAEAAEAVACVSPTADNIAIAQRLRSESDATATTSPFFFNEAKPVKVIGNAATYPAWLSTDLGNAFISRVGLGEFTYAWDTNGAREGDYFICWTWTPHPAGDSLSRNLKFNLGGNTVVTTSIPTHYTNPDKYATLLERYLPEMFKMQMTDTDRSPDIINKFNQAVALGFTAVEDLANQVVDLQDANSTHEYFLPLLANFFGLKLKTNDPTLWRRQIKQAIPLFKQKGTKKGLESALAQAGIKMVKLTKLWQITSSYTWVDAFTADGVDADEVYELTKVALPVDPANFGLWLRPVGEQDYITLTSDYVSFATAEGVTTMSWMGSSLLANPIDLVKGDIIKVMYSYNAVPDPSHQTLENYLRALPLADQRDEAAQQYPLKNWNVRVMAEDDPLFDVLIPSRNPFTEPLVYGKVRTEFPYSENVYNNDEYNGSIRNSKSPCDIDKNFLDPCSACQSSKFNVDLEIENLSNDRILEAQDVIREFSPFHAVLQTMNFTGGITEFVSPPLESVEMLVNVMGGDFVICGQGQNWFNRNMQYITINRSALATSDTPISGHAGTAYNDEITVFSTDVLFEQSGMNTDGTAVLEILAPSPNAGTYHPTNPVGHVVKVTGASEPLNTAAFTFRLSNLLTSGTLCNVYQANRVTFLDVDNPITSVLTQFDVAHNGASAAYKLSIPAYNATPYPILNALPDGSMELQDIAETLPTMTTGSVHYQVLDGSGTVVSTGATGSLTVHKRGRVQSLDVSVQDVHNLIRGKCYVSLSGSQYQVVGFVSATAQDQFYIDGYNGGDVAGTSLVVYQRVADNAVGYMSHRGLELQVDGVNLESTLGIQNGMNPIAGPVENDRFMENYIVTINGQDYFISNIDGDSPAGSTTITLSGPDNYWKTFGAGGTAVTFNITHFTKQPITVPGQQYDLPSETFRTYDRAGREVIDNTIANTPGLGMLAKGNMMHEDVSQTEGILYEIEWADGSKEQGNI